AFLADLDLIDDSLRAHRGARIASGRLEVLREQIHGFGFRLARLDVRENQIRHRVAVDALLCPVDGPLSALPRDEQLRFPEEAFCADDVPALREEDLPQDATEVLATLRVVAEAQRELDPDAVGELVISNTNDHADVLELLVLARFAGLVRRRPEGGFE